MFEQINTQSVAFGKSYTDTLVKAQGYALAGLERITELNLKTFEDSVKATVDFWSQAAEVRDLEGVKAFSQKGMDLAKESAAKLYANSQEVAGVSMKTSEAIGSLAKGSFENAKDTFQTVSDTFAREANAAATKAQATVKKNAR
ncbi:MAG: phasin family protein [Dokdonella sp.]